MILINDAMLSNPKNAVITISRKDCSARKPIPYPESGGILDCIGWLAALLQKKTPKDGFPIQVRMGTWILAILEVT